jgi:dGTPase
MDWADDVAYSVHDVEDFYRAGLIPLDRLTLATKEREAFRRRVEQRWDKIGKKIPLPQGTSPADIVAHIFDDLIRLEGPYNGTRQRRADLYSMGSSLIAKFVKETKLIADANGVKDGLEVPAKTRAIVAVLKELIWAYVIQSPALAAQ